MSCITGTVNDIGQVMEYIEGLHTFIGTITDYEVAVPASTPQTRYTIKNLHTDDIDVTTPAGVTIDGLSTLTLPPMSALYIISYNSTNWYII